MKRLQDQGKENKAVFDRWTKVYADAGKLVSEAIAKAKKQLGAVTAALRATNDQRDALDKRIRDTVAAYSSTATSRIAKTSQVQ